MENSTKINMPTLKADDIIEKAAVIRVQELDTLINNMADSLSKASSGKNLSKYWKTQDELIKDVITSYKIFNKESNKDNATELIKVTNALKAIAGVDLSNILPNFDEFTKSFNNAKKKVGNLDSAFNVKGFKEVFNVFETLEQQGLDVQEVFSRLGAGSNVSKLQNNIRSLEDEVEKLTKKLIIADDARDALKNEFDNFKTGSGISNMMEDLDEANAKLEKLRNEAVETFENFLKITNVAQKRTDQWGMSEYDFDDYRFQDYFQRIKDGSMTAQEAIADFKLQYDYLLKDSSINNDSFGLDQLQAFSTKLDSIFQQVEETSNKINDILSNGVIAKSVQNLSEDTTLSDSQRSIFGNILQDEESLKSVTALFQKLIDETNQTKNTEVFNTEQFTKLESLFTSIESSLSSIKGVLVDVGDGEELSPLLKTIANIESAIDNLSSSVKGIGLNMNIDFGSDTEMEAKAQAKISNALQAYQNLFEHIKMSSAGGSLITQKFFDFDINQFDTPMSKLQAYIKFIKDMREEAKKMFGGQDILKIDTDDKYWNRASAAMGQVKKTFNEMKAASDTNPLENIFGKTDLTEVLNQLSAIVSKLDEISMSANKFADVFKDGLNVNASVEEIEKLTNRVKELESELAKIKTPTTVATPQESNISFGNASTTSAEKFQQITNDTVNVLSDVGKTEDQIVQKIQKERAEAEANNEVLREHLVLLDKAGKVVANHWGSTSNVNGTYTEEQLSQAQGGKIIHAHPGKASFFGGKDLQHLLQDSMYDQIKQIELIWGDSTLSVDKSTLTKQSSSTILNIMRNVRKALTEAYGDNQDGAPSREAREHINAIEKEIFKSIAQKLNVSVTEDGSMAKEVTDSLSDVDKAIIKRFSEIKASVVQDVDASSIIKNTMKDAFPDSFTNTKPETEGMEQVEKATEEAVQAKKDFATANEGVQSSIDGSENPLKLEAELMEQIARSAREAADAKKEFVKANKQVKDSANKSNNDLVDGHSENAEPSGVKKYKKKGYKAHDTGNHDNEKKVSNKAELEQALRELQSEIIASIDESTSFVKEITDFYDSQNDLVKTQTKVGDKNGGVRTYTHSYSTDKEGNTTAWTSHIDSKKYQDQNKIIQEQIKNLQKLSAEKKKAAESERKSTVNQASEDQLEAWKQIQRIRKEIANTNNAKLIEQLEQEKKTYQEQYLAADKILKNNSDLYNSEQRLNELKKISLKTTQQIETSQQRQLNGYDNKLSGYQGKISGYKATIDKFGDDGWTSPEYSDNVQRAQQALKAYEDEVNKLKANPDLINKESLANVEKLGKDFEEAALAIKNMTAAQKGYTQLGAEKAMDKISQMLKENSKMSRQAKADIKAWYDQIKSGNPSASLDVILGKVEEIVRREKEAGRGGKSMWEAIKEKAFYSAASVVGTYFGLNDIIRYGKEGIDTIRELDAAMTEVRKVSNATEAQYKSFQKTISSTAKEIATTNKELLNSSADFLRLGYSLDQASDLAKNATLFVNVGDGVDINAATEDMITAMKAFDIQAEDSIKIVDDYNQIGKYILPKHIVIYGDFLILESSYNG